MSKQAEMTRRGAAAMARATAGRSRMVTSKKVYDRKRDKNGNQKGDSNSGNRSPGF